MTASVQAPSPRAVRRTTLAYYAAYVSLGLFVVLGPSLDVFKERSGSTDGQIALVFLLQAIGYSTGAALSGRAFDRWPGHPVMAVGLVLASCAIASLALASSLPALASVCFLYGLVVGPVDTGGNALLIRLHGDAVGPWMVGLHAAFGVGAALAPLVLAVSRWTTDGINAGLLAVALVGAVCGVAVWRRPSPAEVPATSFQGPTGKKRLAPTNRSLAILIGFFALAVGVEVGFAGWLFTYGIDRGLSDGRASLLNSIFWWSFTAARLFGVPIAGRVSARMQLLADAVVCAVGAAVLVVAPTGAGLWVGTVLVGVGVATMFPAMMNLANETIAVTGSVTSSFIAAAGFGGAAIPWLLGRLFDVRGTGLLPACVLIGSVAVGVSIVCSLRLLHPARNGPSDVVHSDPSGGTE